MCNQLRMPTPLREMEMSWVSVKEWWWSEAGKLMQVSLVPWQIKITGWQMKLCDLLLAYPIAKLVSWCLTSLFSTNIWLYQGWKVRGEELSLPSIGSQRYINLNPVRLFIQQPPKKGKGSRGLVAHRDEYGIIIDNMLYKSAGFSLLFPYVSCVWLCLDFLRMREKERIFIRQILVAGCQTLLLPITLATLNTCSYWME